ncbi:MAG: ABC transporter substrate-binding protein [Rubrivivax sp.]|jgi:branched-chain amino acid transport system substrate-binding protein|nr:ABC transporter substrate-binding protein [Rubrivivax sp.]
MQIIHTKPARAPSRRVLLKLATTTLLSAGALPARAEPGITASEIQIGQNITLMDGRNLYGVEVLAGMKALFDEVNRNGGVLGRKISLRTLDDQNEPARAEANARQLAKDGAFILFGSVEGGPSTAVMAVANDLKLPFFGPLAGSPGLRRPTQPLVFVVRAEHRDEFQALMQHGLRVGLKRVALFHADSAGGREHLANVQKLTADIGMAFGGGVPFKSGITDAELDAAVKQLGEQKVDLVINHGSAPLYERLIRRARAAGSRINFWGVNSGSTPLAASLGPLAHGMVFAQVVPNPWAGKTALVREYQRDYRKALPDAAFSYGSLEGYATAKALVLALRSAGKQPTRASLLAALQDFDADLGGLSVRYRQGAHTGSRFVDLALVSREGRFVQ